MFVGKVAQGEKCTDDVECAPVAGRQVACASSEGGERRCTVRARAGEACGSNVDCERDLSCKTEGSGGVCAARAKKGESCDGTTCASGLTCDGDSRLCVDPPAIGAACTIGCAAGAYCSSGKCVAQKPLGESCKMSFECASRLCRGDKCVDNAFADEASCKAPASSSASSSSDAPAPSP